MHIIKVITFWMDVIEVFEHVPIEKGADKEHAVYSVEEAAVLWKYLPAIFEITASFKKAFNEVAKDGKAGTYYTE